MLQPYTITMVVVNKQRIDEVERVIATILGLKGNFLEINKLVCGFRLTVLHKLPVSCKKNLLSK